MRMKLNKRESASFRDPSGFLYWQEGELYRQVNQKYQGDYEMLMESGLYQNLVDADLLIPHQEVEVEPYDAENAYRIIRPERVAFISYPYEWSFGQIKAAALLTLAIQQRAMAHGMSLKDSSAYNVQFWRGRPVLIDTLSFERYEEGLPWVAYRQFCQHFLAPLALMSYRDVRLNQLLRIYIDGIPLDLASRLLPPRTHFNFPLLSHIHIHAAAQQRYAGQKLELDHPRREVSKAGILGILSSLEAAIQKLAWQPAGTAWADYGVTHNYSESSLAHKKKIVDSFLDRIAPKNVWDMGANTGFFSRLSSQRGIPTLAWDIDPGAVELNYQQCIAEKDENLLPLILDLTNPSPNLGWHNHERLCIQERGSAEMVLALALVHHLAIANNIPLDQIARFFADLGNWLVIEFVPKHDPQTQKLLAVREDIFIEYTQSDFENAFSAYYKIQEVEQIFDSGRMMYLMQRK
ncbi:MAG: SAM-dependent methyltransferase [Anaerolineales bacterium]|nr:SAM-dependent methyltransferase [Anaerolineales bacterium]